MSEAAALSTLSRSLLTRLVMNGTIASTKIGRRRLVLVPALLKFLDPKA